MDKEQSKIVIEKLGGPAALSRLLGLPKKSGVQTCFNWLSRGIPWKMQVQFKDIFDKVID